MRCHPDPQVQTILLQVAKLFAPFNRVPIFRVTRCGLAELEVQLKFQDHAVSQRVHRETLDWMSPEVFGDFSERFAWQLFARWVRLAGPAVNDADGYVYLDPVQLSEDWGISHEPTS